MSTRMLIDARHPEETRVTVVKGSRVEDFDYESATRRQLKGNIYLARVTRVEPSLQAAFVEYGGNRHGFLAFSEIHPDYYQIPIEDREALIEAETAVTSAGLDTEDDADAKKRRPRRRRGRKPTAEAAQKESKESESESKEDSNSENNPETSSETSSEANPKTSTETGSEANPETTDTPAPKTIAETATDTDAIITEDAAAAPADAEASADKTAVALDGANTDTDTETDANADTNSDANADEDDDVEEVKESDEDEKDAEIEAVAAARRQNLRALKRRYSIQEVIKRRQVLLIQVVKEERGNKGAALTTYMSLAGRYCVLMPNSTHSGGISRKISNLSDRKKLKQVIGSLDVPEDMGLIVRTAGINRTKTEIKRDYDYLMRLWNGIRDLTLKSTAPALIYEEGNLIKRTIRDVYTRDIDEIWVEGDRGYRAAKDFMKLLMPSHAKKVQHYKDRIPLYHRYQVENQLEAMYQPVVQLKSGGYIVINPTEALISIDVNSGRATKQHNIEETAVNTNIEAAEEVARQLRLRDMAGLVVIDFIDMEDRGNNRAVERRMKDMLKNDRARIQVGRISSFGLMEMSRQRLRPNLLEVAMETCSHCAGMGLVRSVESASIMALRQLEEEGIRNRSSLVKIKANPEVAIYLLNQKRAVLSDLEREYKLTIIVSGEPALGPSDIEITHEANIETKPVVASEGVVVKMDSTTADMIDNADTDSYDADDTPKSAPTPVSKPVANDQDDDDQPRKKRRRRRRRRRGGAEDGENNPQANKQDENRDSTVKADEQDAAPKSGDDDGKSESPTRRRRGSRGGRRRRGRDDIRATQPKEAADSASNEATDAKTAISADETKSAVKDDAQASKRVPRRRSVKKDTADKAADVQHAVKPSGADDTADDVKKPAPRRRRKKADDTAPTETKETSAVNKADASPSEPSSAAESSGPKKKGWWGRTFG